jgi:hypothetical protein
LARLCWASLATEAGWHSPVVGSDALTEARVKRLTLDIPADLHRALKIRAAALDVLMVELLRVLIEQALEDPSTLANLVEVQR